MKILITAGPTYEKIDPVRFIGNRSTGKMGYALAEECLKRGLEVLLISGAAVSIPTPNGNIHRIDVESAEEMYNAVMQNIKSCDVAIFCAAVADFTPESVYDHKLKRKGDELIIRLKPTKDIAAAAGKSKTSNQIFVGFALETDNEANNALDKMQRKNLDMIVLNSLNDTGAGFGYDTNKVTIMLKNGEQNALPLMSKNQVAQQIINKIIELYEIQNNI